MKFPDIQALPLNPTFLQIFLAIFLIACAYGVATVVAFVLGRLSERFPARRLLFKRLQPIPQIGVYVIATYLIIKLLGPQQTSLFAIVGSMALALGLAAQDLLKDIIGGIVVLVDKPYQIGDRIRVDSFYGEVISVGLRSTKLVTSENRQVTIPNSEIVRDGVTNTNAGAVECLVTTRIYIPADLDLVTIETVAREAVLTSKGAYLKKPITVLVKDDPTRNLVHLDICAYVFDTRYEETFASDLTRRIRHVLFEKARLAAERKEEITLEQIDERVRDAMAEHLMALGQRFVHRNNSEAR
jgi:small-conductance mechanosensitive channel